MAREGKTSPPPRILKGTGEQPDRVSQLCFRVVHLSLAAPLAEDAPPDLKQNKDSFCPKPARRVFV